MSIVIKQITDPEVVTGQLRQLEIYRRQRKEAGFNNTSTQDLLQEAHLLISLLETQRRMIINIMGERVRESIERKKFIERY
ncbi:MAG: hypothetical protein Q7T59_01370 [Candidatus Woesebacteria bacterium]|nr:hypothetical protein [Candidatus Woesebacteria bacterium]